MVRPSNLPDNKRTPNTRNCWKGCNLVVVGVETGGRFGQEAIDFVDSLAAAKARYSDHFASVNSPGVERALDVDVSRLLCTLVRRFGIGRRMVRH